ncbi:hypothetical protein ABPG72_000130 [Tetrahymena utriculariae]
MPLYRIQFIYFFCRKFFMINIFYKISCLFLKNYSSIPLIVVIEKPKTPLANNIIKMQTIISIGVTGTISPYPTVDIVTVQKQKEFKYYIYHESLRCQVLVIQLFPYKNSENFAVNIQRQAQMWAIKSTLRKRSSKLRKSLTFGCKIQLYYKFLYTLIQLFHLIKIERVMN